MAKKAHLLETTSAPNPVASPAKLNEAVALSTRGHRVRSKRVWVNERVYLGAKGLVQIAWKRRSGWEGIYARQNCFCRGLKVVVAVVCG